MRGLFFFFFFPQDLCNSKWRGFNSFTGLTQNSQREKCWSLEGPPLSSPASLLVIGLQIKRSWVSVFNEKSFIHNQASNFLAERIGFYRVILKLRRFPSYSLMHSACKAAQADQSSFPRQTVGMLSGDQRERMLFKM